MQQRKRRCCCFALDLKRKAAQPLVKDVYLSKQKQDDLTMALYDFFLESSDCVAMHVCEHPALAYHP